MVNASDARSFRPGVRLGLDWGRSRIGVAACDAQGLLSYPVATVTNSPDAVKKITDLVAEYEAIEIVLGLPTDLRGNSGVAAQAMLEVAEQLDGVVGVPVRLVDERMTSVSAHRQLASVGRSSKQRKNMIDQASAVLILDYAIQMERRTGVAPGYLAERQTKGDVDE